MPKKPERKETKPKPPKTDLSEEIAKLEKIARKIERMEYEPGMIDKGTGFPVRPFDDLDKAEACLIGGTMGIKLLITYLTKLSKTGQLDNPDADTLQLLKLIRDGLANVLALSSEPYPTKMAKKIKNNLGELDPHEDIRAHMNATHWVTYLTEAQDTIEFFIKKIDALLKKKK